MAVVCICSLGSYARHLRFVSSRRWVLHTSLAKINSSNFLIEHSEVAFCTQIRHYSTPPPRKNFISQFIDNIRQDIALNKEMKENLRKFRMETEKLEKSEALQKARKKYETLETETEKSSAVLKEKLEKFKGKLQETLEEAQQSELGRRASQLSDDIAKSAKDAAEAVSEKTESLGKSSAFRAISDSVKAVKEEIDETALSRARMYKPPKKLRKRIETSSDDDKNQAVAPNVEATGVELHKDSKWYQSWRNFKDNNPYVNKVFHWKSKYDESDNPVARASRLLTDKVSDVIGGMFQKTELSEVLTEICKMDPTFEKEKFLKDCENDIIPNILEAIVQGNLEILKDWCHEAPFNVIAAPIKQAQAMGMKMDSHVLDVSHVDLAMGKMMEQGPVLIISFQSQQIMAVRNAKGEIVEGSLDEVVRMYYVWALCRDQTMLDPKAAWRLVDLSANSSKQWL